MRNKIAIVLGLALASSAAIAGNTGIDLNAKSFSDLDADGNGKLSQTEVSSNTKIVFSTADTNGDGAISQTEYKAALSAHKDGADKGMKY